MQGSLYKMIFSNWLGIVLMTMPIAAWSQVPQNPIGLTPASLKWNQINTHRVQVIFPAGMEKAGQRVTNIVHHLWDHNNSVGELNKKISILLHNQTTRPNGLVTPGPFRSEFYTRSPLFNCTSDWIDLVAIHEYQHVKQFANADQGITKLSRLLFGSWVWGGFAATAMPRWFWEGDATFQETYFSKSGRGRLPAFHMEYKALMNANRIPDYEKAGARSFKEFIPNWYPLGYYMTVYARKQFGDTIWSEVVSDAVRYKGLFYPFNKSLKKKSGMSTKQLFKATMQDLKLSYPEYQPQPRSTKKKILSTTPKIYTNYSNPHFVNNNSFIAIKSGFDHIPQIVGLEPEQIENRYVAMGVLPEIHQASTSFANGLVCWAENTLDPRWRYKNYSIIRVYNTQTGNRKSLTKKSKYFGPELNSDASKILTVEATELNEYSLVVLDTDSGNIIHQYPNPNNVTLLHSCWAMDGQTVYAVVQENECHYIASVDKSGNMDALSPKLPHQISHPYAHEQKIFFAAAYQETNQIYVLDIGDQSIHQVTQSKLGAFMPHVSSDGSALLYSEYTVDGYQIILAPLDSSQWIQFKPDDYHSFYYGQDLLEHSHSMLANLESTSYPIEKFRKSSKLFQFHSLLPSVDHPVYGLSLLSDNKLGTMRGEVGGIYNVNENTLSGIASFTFAGWYPEFSFTALHRNRSASAFDFSLPNDTTLRTNFYTEEWSENVGQFGVALPFRFQTGHYFHSLRLSTSVSFIQPQVGDNRTDLANNRDTFRIESSLTPAFKTLERDLLSNESFGTFDFTFSWQSLRNRARRHLNPQVGIATSASYRESLGDEAKSSYFSVRANIYLPGIKPTHSLWFQLGYRNQSILDIYRFTDRFNYTRGYGSNLSDEYSRASLNYSFPIWYPDIAIGSLAYLQRVKLNMFFDVSVLKIGFPFEIQDNLNAVGIDLGLDFRALRLLDMDLGIRYSYLLNPDYSPNGSRHQFDFLVLSISG